MTGTPPGSERLEALLADAPATMSVHQVAEALSISKLVVRRLLSTSELQGLKVGREWRILRSDLLEYLESSSNRAGEPQ